MAEVTGSASNSDCEQLRTRLDSSERASGAVSGTPKTSDDTRLSQSIWAEEEPKKAFPTSELLRPGKKETLLIDFSIVSTLRPLMRGATAYLRITRVKRTTEIRAILHIYSHTSPLLSCRELLSCPRRRCRHQTPAT
jgi:hypothetical protein